MDMRLTNIQLNNDWSNTISIHNCVLCHSQKFDGQSTGTIKPEYKNSEFSFAYSIKTLTGHFRYQLSTIISGIQERLKLPFTSRGTHLF